MDMISFRLALPLLALVWLAHNPQTAAAQSEEWVRVKLKDQPAEVTDSVIRISDVAIIESDSPKYKKTIGDLDLDVFNSESNATVITKTQIRLRIQLSASRVSRLSMAGPESVTAKRITARNQMMLIQEKIGSAIADQFSLSPADIRVSFDDSAVQKNELHELTQSISAATVVLPPDIPVGDTDVKFLFQSSSGENRTIELRCQVTLFTDMLLSKGFIPRGTELTKDHFEVVRRALDDKRIKPAKYAQALGRRTSTNIDLYQIISVNNLSKATNPILVKRNDIVEILSGGRGFLAIQDAKVLTPGRKGDRIEVLNIDSKRKLVATVINERQVKIR